MVAGIYIIRRRRKKQSIPPAQFKVWHIAAIFQILVALFILIMPWYPPEDGATGGNVCCTLQFIPTTPLLIFFAWSCNPISNTTRFRYHSGMRHIAWLASGFSQGVVYITVSGFGSYRESTTIVLELRRLFWNEMARSPIVYSRYPTRRLRNGIKHMTMRET